MKNLNFKVLWYQVWTEQPIITFFFFTNILIVIILCCKYVRTKDNYSGEYLDKFNRNTNKKMFNGVIIKLEHHN